MSNRRPLIQRLVLRLSQRPALPPWLITIGKVGLVFSILALLYYSIQQKADMDEEFFGAFDQVLRHQNWGIGLLILGLLFLNLGIEAVKWQLVASKIEKLDFIEALRGVLTGISLSFLSTSYTGNYLGRVWHMREKNRYHILGGMVVNSLSQAAVTYLFGGVGFLYLLKWVGWLSEANYQWAVPAYAIYGITVIYIVFRSTGMVSRLKGWPWLHRHVKVMADYGMKDSGRIILLSTLRYFTFTWQFVLCLMLFDPSIPVAHALSGVSIIYLAKATVPNVSFLTDLGLRELSAVQLFGQHGFAASEGAVMAATLSLWGINLLLPVIAGSYFVITMKPTQKGSS